MIYPGNGGVGLGPYSLKVLGFSYEEIGRITGASYSTVNRQLVRAAALIRRARAS